MVWPKLRTALAAQATSAGKMTFRNVAVNVVRRSREIFEGIFHRKNPGTRDFGRHEAENFTKTAQAPSKLWSSKSGFLGKSSSWVQSLARYSSQTLAGELRRRAAYQFHSGSAALYGRALGISRRVPLYAFVGLNLGVATANRGSQNTDLGQGFDKVCEHIKTMFQPTRIIEDEILDEGELGVQVDDYEFGPMIAKGCNAAVYQAKRRTTEGSEAEEIPMAEEDMKVILEEDQEHLESRSDTSESPDSFVIIPEEEEPIANVIPELENEVISWTGSDITVISEEGAPETTEGKCSSSDNIQQVAEPDYDLAVKMMFNYDAGSTAPTILRTMQNEVVPAKMADTNSQMDQWENGNHAKKKKVPTATLR